MTCAALLALTLLAADPEFKPDQAKLPVPPPKGATALLDHQGKHLFLSMAGEKIDWPIEDGVIVSTSNRKNQNHIVSQLHFKDADIHVEFLLPEKGAANSGVYIHGHYEIQILNSFGKAKVTQEDAGAVYGFAAPLENACRKPGEWQVFDIRYRAPRRDAAGKIVENGRVTVWFNGKKVQDNTEFGEPKSTFHPFRYGNTPYLDKVRDRQKQTMTGPVFLQDHGSPVKFRNVWVLPAEEPAGTSGARRADPLSDRSLLTVGRLFGVKEFDTEPLPARRWSKRTAAYFSLEKLAAGKGAELLSCDPATGKKEVVVPAAAFVPEGAKEPLAVDGYEFSADESKLLVYSNSQRVWRRNTRGDYWILDVAARKLRKLGGDAAPASLQFATLAPDGTRVAYVRENNLYVQDLVSLKITALTTNGSKTLINGTSDWVNEEELNLRNCFRWSPDSRHVLFWQFDTTGVSEFHLIDNVVSKSPRITSFAYPKVGEKNSATRLGVIPVAGGKVQWLDLPGDAREHYLPHADWTPDGSRILVQQFNRLQTELRVWRVDPATGQAAAVFTEKDAAWLENDNPWRWLNGGRDILWLSERSGWRQAYRAPVDGAPLEPITKGAFDVIGVEAVDEAGGWLYYAASPKNATQRHLFRARLDGSRTEQFSAEEQGGWHEYDFSPNMQWAVHTFSTFTTPPVVELVRLSDNTAVRTLTDNAKLRAKLAALKRPEIEFLKVPIGGGVVLDGWSMKPAKIDPAARLPLLMYVYGEPLGQTVRDAWPGARGLWHWMLAQEGFVVASVDNRGTKAPRGREWRKAVHRQIGILAPTEQAAAVRALLQQWPFVDASRVGSWGLSGGGSMSLNALFRHPDLYRAAIAAAPVADQTLYNTIYQERYMGLPADNAAGYRDGSPITHAGKMRGNLLLIHGTGDDNCHYQATERLMEELIARGKRFNVLPYPNRSHALREGRNTDQHLMDTMTRFLRDNLQSPHAPAPDPLYETHILRGWTLHVHRELLAADARQTLKALQLLDKQLEEITNAVPNAAVAKLQKVRLYFNPEYAGVRPIAEYHPGADWLRKNGRDPAMAKSVEFTNVRIYEAEVNRMPWFVLHELAHAYHDRELPQGFANPAIAAAYARARDSGKYDKVERHLGNDRPSTVEKAYAMTTPMEYFAEATEAYFGRNDFFPFNRDELKKHDPSMAELLGKLWQAAADPPPADGASPH